jgi:hypothetical protein
MSFNWDPSSAGRKFFGANGGANISVGIPGVASVEQKSPTMGYSSKKDSYRNCSNCKKHINLHNNGNCKK